jgi:hypothetical protein
MEKQLVIVRDYRGTPLRRVAWRSESGRILVSSERALAATESGQLPAIGCPEGDIFQYDTAKFDQLEKEWNENNRVCDDSWSILTPLSAAVPLPERQR